jgi:hypothetical protein
MYVYMSLLVSTSAKRTDQSYWQDGCGHTGRDTGRTGPAQAHQAQRVSWPRHSTCWEVNIIY